MPNIVKIKNIGINDHPINLINPVIAFSTKLLVLFSVLCKN